jgi:hypothetical protein
MVAKAPFFTPSTAEGALIQSQMPPPMAPPASSATTETGAANNAKTLATPRNFFVIIFPTLISLFWHSHPVGNSHNEISVSSPKAWISVIFSDQR